MPVDTKSAPRRPLSLKTLDDLDAELVRIEQAEAQGRLTHTGNYSPGQTTHHLARWIQIYETGELPAKVPPHIALVGRLFKKKFLTKGFPAGLPGPGGIAQPEPDVTLAEGLEFLRSKLQVLRSTDLSHKNPMFGKMTQADIIELQLRHAELHLSFLQLQDAD